MSLSESEERLAGSRRGAARAVVIIATAVVLAAAGVYLAWTPPAEEAVAGRRGGPAPVLVEAARMERTLDELEALGTVRANEIVALSSKVTERIETIHFEDGGLVSAGDLLVQLRDAEQQAELAEARAQLSERERQLERVRSVGDSGAVSQSALDGELARYDSAKARVALFESRIADRRISAPFDGQLGLRRVSPGELVSSGTELITLSDLTPVKVDFTVPERYIGKVQSGQAIEASSIAYPEEAFVGRIQTVSPVVDPVTRAAQVRALASNDEQKLKPGMLLQVRVALGEREALTVSESALSPVGARQYVLVLDEDDIPRRREVEVGLRRDGRVEIARGLEAGERVVTHGYRATPGEPVRISGESQVFTVAGSEG